MAKQCWTPHVTVATVVEKDGLFLLVHENPDDRPVYNQPAGHLDEGESLITAAVRETFEETGWRITISDYLGVYRYLAANGVTYLRHGFVGQTVEHNPNQPLDTGIIEAVWLTYAEIVANQAQLRSPMVLRLIDDYLADRRYPLAVLHEEDA